jgi:serine/threonine protein kinase
MPLTTGYTLINRYRIIKLLGQGGFGAVYQAWDSSLNSYVAVKESLRASPGAQEQFELEARLLTRLRHPNLPCVTDHFTVKGQGQYLVMEYIEGDDLNVTLKNNNRPLHEKLVIGWLSQICDALTYLHSQKPPTIHRDIKPANIRITPQGNAMLVDFGIATIFAQGADTNLGARAITPGYSPPEQYGLGQTNAQSDIYALGATAYHLLTGRIPPPALEISVGNISRPKPVRDLNPLISIAVSAALEKAMQINYKNRWGSAAEFKKALEEASQLILLPPTHSPDHAQKTSLAEAGLSLWLNELRRGIKRIISVLINRSFS